MPGFYSSLTKMLAFFSPTFILYWTCLKTKTKINTLIKLSLNHHGQGNILGLGCFHNFYCYLLRAGWFQRAIEWRDETEKVEVITNSASSFIWFLLFVCMWLLPKNVSALQTPADGDKIKCVSPRCEPWM